MILVSHTIGAGLIILHIVLESRVIKAGFDIKVLLLLGVLSSGMYAWHGFLANNAIFLDDLLTHSALCLILAYITYLIVERPMLALKR